MPLRIGSYRYDTTRALFDGSVQVEGTETEMVTGPTLVDVFRDFVSEGRTDVSELGLTMFLRLLDVDDTYVAIPAFPNRVFRHSSVFVHRGSGITSPTDLAGKRLGEFAFYSQDPGVWIKGILMDEFGFRPERSQWVIGQLEAGRPVSFDFMPHAVPAGVPVEPVPPGQALGPMLARGEIDALFTANVPQAVLDGSADIVRLFPDYEQRERDYFRRTGIFPMMHVIAARRSFVDAHPGLARRVYDAFLRAKDLAAGQYRQARRIYQASTMLPWATALFEENRELLPDDWWPYGVAANRHALNTYLRYFHEQGLTPRRRQVEELFVPDLLDT